MTRRGVRWMVALGALAASWAAPALGAESKMRLVAYVTSVDTKPVGDVEGHVTGTWQRRGLCLLETGEVAVYLGAGTLEYTKGKGVVHGQSTCTFEDGSSTTTQWTVNVVHDPKGLAFYSDGKGEYVSGTGRFKGIRGTTTFSGRTYTPNKGETKGDVVMDVQAKYTLPTS